MAKNTPHHSSPPILLLSLLALLLDVNEVDDGCRRSRGDDVKNGDGMGAGMSVAAPWTVAIAVSCPLLKLFKSFAGGFFLERADKDQIVLAAVEVGGAAGAELQRAGDRCR